MPRKAAAANDTPEEIGTNESEEKVEQLNRMLAAVIKYISDDEVSEIDIEYLMNTTEGLREWWEQYQEIAKKELEEEIKHSLGELSLTELEKIREKIKEKQEEE